MYFTPKPTREKQLHVPILFKHGASQQEKDFAVWEAFKSGNKLAFDHIFDSNIKMLYSYGSGLIKDRDLVADCVQELFIELWNKREILGNTTNIKFYLFKSLRRRIIRKNETEQRRSNNELTNPFQETFDSSCESAIILDEVNVEKKQSLAQAMSVITKRQREAILLRYYKKLSFEEMASHMKMDVPSIRNVLSKAIQNLRLQLGDQFNKILTITVLLVNLILF